MASKGRTRKGAVELVTMGRNDMVVRLVGGAEEEDHRLIIRAVEQVGGPGGLVNPVAICCDGLCCNGLKNRTLEIDTVINERDEGATHIVEHVTNRPR